jgi:hypothetical protein
MAIQGGVNGQPIPERWWVRNFWREVNQEIGFAWSEAIADRPRLTTQDIEKQLSTSKRWLWSSVFVSFHDNDFQFLSLPELKFLTDAVQRVRAVASEIDSEGVATADQLNRARADFVKIVNLMEFDRFDDGDAYFLGKTIERRLANKWPLPLDHLRFRTGQDSTDDPALWVWAFVAETGEYEEARFLERTDVIEEVLEPIAREAAPEGRLYLRFRSTLDLPEAQGVLA